MTQTTYQSSNRDMAIALLAYFIWGLFPLYFKQLTQYAALEIIIHRIIWTTLSTIPLLIIFKKYQWLRVICREPRWIAYTLVSGILIALNWLTYVWAVTHNQVTEASLGYFISPLLGVLAAGVILKEALRPLQVVAIALASSSVVGMLIVMGYLPWVALVMASCFVIYGLMHRYNPIEPLPAMFIETLLLTPIGLFWLLRHDYASSSWAFWSSPQLGLLILAGPITLLPLLLYNLSTKRMPFTVLSFLGYIVPSMLFIQGVFFYQEPFEMTRLIAFAVIWMALVVYSYDLWQHWKTQG